MKTIEQVTYIDIKVEHPVNGDITIHQDSDSISIDKKGAKQLIEVLKEWVGDE